MISRKSLLVTLFALIIPIIASCQTLISERWIHESGKTATPHKATAKTDESNSVYVASTNLNLDDNNDIVIRKTDSDGNLIWQANFDGLGNGNDEASDIFVDKNKNIYVTGTSVTSSGGSSDLVVLKYSSDGSLEWTYYYNYSSSSSPFSSLRGLGTSITGDNNGNIFVTGGSYDDNSMADFITIRLDPINGTEIWSQRYDHILLNDVASQINVDNSHVYISGGSQTNTSPVTWELATIAYDLNDGSQLYINRSNGNSLNGGIDEVYGLATDNSGNIYVVGATVNSTTEYDISIYKFDSQLNIVWENYYDGHNLDDKGHSVKVDTEGNVYVLGYVSTPTEGKNYSVLKYSSDGTLRWSRELNSLRSQDDEAIDFVLRKNKVFIVGTTNSNEGNEIKIVGCDPNGNFFSARSYKNSPGLSCKANSITLDFDQNLVVSGQIETPHGKHKNIVIKYELFDKKNIPVYDPPQIRSHLDNEVLVRFNPSDLILSNVDNKKITWGYVHDFVKPEAISAISKNIDLNLGALKCYKVHPNLTSADSTSQSRLGNVVNLPPFYGTFGIILPPNTKERLVTEDLILSTPHIITSSLNFYLQLNTGANDPFYNDGSSAGLTPSSSIPDAGINIEPAWDYETGQSSVIVGIYDSGINNNHPDISNGDFSSSSIVDGYDYFNSVSINTNSDPDNLGHGSAIAGIIGAWRNNNSGIAGIAGGSDGNGGVSIHDMKIFDIEPEDDCNDSSVPLNIVLQAMIEGSTNIIMPRQDVQNHSWSSSPPNNPFLREAFNTAYANEIVLCAAAGNSGTSSFGCNVVSYPASYTDHMIMKVGANDATGETVSFSECGFGLDFIAPGTNDLYLAMEANGNSYSDVFVWDEGNCNAAVNGTSFATPHVAGLSALMLSYAESHSLPYVFSHEDCEQLIERNTTDLTTPGYDDRTGWGRINAGEVFRNISFPEFRIEHYQFAVKLENATLDGPQELLCLEQSLFGLPVGPTNARRWKITGSASHSLPPGYTLLGGWPRGSGCRNVTGIRSVPFSNVVCGGSMPDSFLPSELNADLDVFTDNSATMSGYFYEILDESLNHVGWWPTDPSDIAGFAYTLYLIDLSVNTEEADDKSSYLTIYPNPANSSITVNVENPGGTKSILITNVSGQTLKEIRDTRNTSITIDISGFPAGAYFVSTKSDQHQEIKKIIIQ